MLERAITLLTREILKSDDSSGAQGEQIAGLLTAHAEAAGRSDPALAQSAQTRLVKWMVQYRYEGKQDFFDPDIVADAPGLSAKSSSQYCAAIARVDLGKYGHYPLTRLAVLDHEAILALRGGEPQSAGQALLVVRDLEDAGLRTDALTYADLGITLDDRGWSDQLIRFLVDDAIEQDDRRAAVDLRRGWLSRFPGAPSFTGLREIAESAGVWDEERAGAERLLAQTDPQAFARYLLGENRATEAWECASRHIDS